MAPTGESGTNDQDFTPQPKPEAKRQGGGAGSGLPPAYKIGVELEDWGKRQPAAMTNAFGIDFGQHKTRVAGLCRGVPLMVPPKVVETLITLDSDAETEPIRNLRTLLLSDSSAEKAEGLVRQLFGSIRETVEQSCAIARPRIVLTVPAYYCSEQREQLMRCANAAGFDVIGLINDYAAAVYSFVRANAARRGNLLVISIGAASLNTGVLNVTEDLIETACSLSVPGFSAAHVIEFVAEHLFEECAGGVGDYKDLAAEELCFWNEVALKFLRGESRRKGAQIISGEGMQSVQIESARLLDIVAGALHKVIDCVKATMEEAGLRRSELDHVLMVGGLIQSSMVSKFLTQSMPKLHRVVLNSDRSGCFGAAIRAGVVEQKLEGPLLWDVLTQAIYIRQKFVVEPLIGAGVPLPLTRRIESCEAAVEQDRVTMDGIVDGVTVKCGTGMQTAESCLEISVDVNGIVSHRMVAGE